MGSLLTCKFIYWDSLTTNLVFFGLEACVFISPPSFSDAISHASSIQSHPIEHQMVKIHVTTVEVSRTHYYATPHPTTWSATPSPCVERPYSVPFIALIQRCCNSICMRLFWVLTVCCYTADDQSGNGLTWRSAGGPVKCFRYWLIGLRRKRW